MLQNSAEHTYLINTCLLDKKADIDANFKHDALPTTLLVFPILVYLHLHDLHYLLVLS